MASEGSTISQQLAILRMKTLVETWRAGNIPTPRVWFASVVGSPVRGRVRFEED
jgi:hypothetical protein